MAIDGNEPGVLQIKVLDKNEVIRWMALDEMANELEALAQKKKAALAAALRKGGKGK